MRAQAIDHQLRPEAVAEKADDAIHVAHRRYLGGADDDRFLRAGYGILEAQFDAGRAIDEHVVEALAQRCDERLHLRRLDLVFLARLRRREQEQVFAVLVGDEGVFERRALFEYVE